MASGALPTGVSPVGLPGSVGEPLGRPALADATALPFGSATPDAMVDPVGECVLEALGFDRAIHADTTCCVHADAIRGEELAGGLVGAVAHGHPLGVYRCSLHMWSLTLWGRLLFPSFTSD